MVVAGKNRSSDSNIEEYRVGERARVPCGKTYSVAYTLFSVLSRALSLLSRLCKNGELLLRTTPKKCPTDIENCP